MELKKIENLELKGKRVFIRVDFNVPLDDNGKVTDDTRIVKTLPTIDLLVKKGAKVIVASHTGRPKGEVNPKYSMKPAYEKFAELVKYKVSFSDKVVGPEVEEKSKALGDGEVLVLENLRFHAEEEKNDPEFSKKLSQLADVYMNDAFGAAHRAHASTEGITKYLPSYAGLLMAKEIEVLGGVISNAEKPFVAIIGGSKVSSKIAVLENMMEKVNTILIGGGMAYTFLKSKGLPIGKSLVEEDYVDNAAKMLEKAAAKGVKFLLPVDHIIADDFNPNANKKTVGEDGIEDGWMGMDIGPKTIENYSKEVIGAKTILWNGPMGVFEMDAFADGTMKLADAVAKSSGKAIVGGGDSVAAANKAGIADKMFHVSTGGGASLEFLEGKKLPGVEAILNNKL